MQLHAVKSICTGILCYWYDLFEPQLRSYSLSQKTISTTWNLLSCLNRNCPPVSCKTLAVHTCIPSSSNITPQSHSLFRLTDILFCEACNASCRQSLIKSNLPELYWRDYPGRMYIPGPLNSSKRLLRTLRKRYRSNYYRNLYDSTYALVG